MISILKKIVLRAFGHDSSAEMLRMYSHIVLLRTELDGAIEALERQGDDLATVQAQRDELLRAVDGVVKTKWFRRARPMPSAARLAHTFTQVQSEAGR